MIDMNWLAPTLTAVAAVISAIASGLALWKAAGAKKQSLETHLAVDGRLEKFLETATGQAAAEATLLEKHAERNRQNAIVAGAAVVAERDRLAALAVADKIPIAAHELLTDAETQAKKLIEDAALAAAKLLAEAHRVKSEGEPDKS